MISQQMKVEADVRIQLSFTKLEIKGICKM